MSIFQVFLTQQWAILVKSLRDVQMASISNRKSLAKGTTLRGTPFSPICSPFVRLNDLAYEFTAWVRGMTRAAY